MDLFGKDMKISDYPKEKINIYSSEMSSEIVESYEKYYKSLNESISNKIQNEIHFDTEKIFEKNEDNSQNDNGTKLNVSMMSVIDSDRKRVRIEVAESSTDLLPNKKRKKEFEPPKLQEDNRDIFCWRCHKYVGIGEIIACYFCPRVFHLKCSHIQEKPSTFWLCTECDAISTAENPDKISAALSKLQKKDMAELLMYVLKRMRQHEGSSHFENPVDPESYPDYKDYIIKPMYLSLLEDNVKNMKYASCESFLADTKWMVHNSYVFNTVHSELTLYAKAMMKNAKHECEEIINCPDCYLHANTLSEDKWFIEPCDKPHVLVWARLKGFPYWPCKVMKANRTSVDVRFFGDHNKSLVPVDCCYLYSKQMPSKQKKVDELELAIKEAALHIKKLEEKYHVFQYASLKLQYNPKEEDEQRKLLLPYHDKPFFIKVKDKEKLLDPKIVRNIFEEPYPILNCNNAQKGEEKNKTISDLSIEVGVNSENHIIKSQNEGASSSYTPSFVNRNVSPLNKPKIIIEESDSNILSKGSYGVPRQHIVREYEKLNSSFITNNSRKSTEKHRVGGIIQSNYENDNVISFTKALNLRQKTSNFESNHFNNDKYQSNFLNSPEEKLGLQNFSKEDVLAEKSENYEKNKISIPNTSNTENVRSSTNQSLDKSNNNHISDKLRISSNAKLINVITDNPALINNYIFKPMVVIQKLRDEVFRDYSNNYRKTELMVSNKLSATNETNSEKTSSSSPVENIALNFDLLNGNITNLVSVTEIDLDKDESSKFNILKNKEAEKTDKSNTAQASNCLRSGDHFLKPVIKSENTEDEQLDNDYIEKLSKSILESALDNSNDVENRNKNEFESNSAVENGYSERVSNLGMKRLPCTENETVSNDVATNDQDPLSTDNEKETYEEKATFSPDIECEMNKAINGNCKINSKLFDKILINQEFSSVTEKYTNNSLSVENNVIVNEKTCTINSLKNPVNIKSNVVNKNLNKLLENDKSHIPLQKVEMVGEKIETVNLIKELKNSEDTSTKHKEFEIISQGNRFKKDQIYSPGSKKCNIIVVEDDDILNDNLKVKCQTKPVLQSEVIGNKKNLTAPHVDSDCEIVNIVFPSNCRKILKPIGYKRLKTSGGVIKKVFRSGMLLPTSRRRPDHNMTLKNMEFHNLPNKSKFHNKTLQFSNNSINQARNFAATAGKSGYRRKIINLERGFEKNVNSCITENIKIREEEKMMDFEIDNILSKVEKLDSKVSLLEMLREELKKFEDHCKKKVESYKNAYIEEMDALYTMEKQRWIQESMNVSENESKMMIDEIKKKQWCILCLNEAKFHCCWSTSYCSEKCQLADWPIHMKTCTQYTMRAGDPDLRISPDMKKIFRGELETIRDLKIKDIIDSLPESHLQKNEAACSSLYNSSCANPILSFTNNSTDSTVTSSKSSTVYISKKSSSKLDKSQEASETSITQAANLIPNQTVYVSGVTTTPTQAKSVIHVPKQSTIKLNIPNQDHCSGGLADNSKSISFTVPLPNRNNALVSIGNGIHSNSGNTSNSNNNHTVLMGGQHFILPKSLISTKVIKKTIPIVAPNDVGCAQENNRHKAKPFYIAMPSRALRDKEDTEGIHTNQLDNPKGTRILKLEQPKLLKEPLDQTSLQKNDFANSAQPYLIVEKSGESSQFTFRIGFQDGIEKVNILPSLVPRQTVSPLAYPVICDPSPGIEPAKISASN